VKFKPVTDGSITWKMGGCFSPAGCRQPTDPNSSTRAVAIVVKELFFGFDRIECRVFVILEEE
jgi:hypothetical protein